MTKKVPGMLTRSAADINDLARAMPERVHLELGALTSAVPMTRTWARVILSGWHLARLADDAGLILSELVTNSVVHTSGPTVSVWLMSDRERLVIMVGDPCPDMPVPCTESHDSDELFGRGLVIVDALAEIVWAMLT
jgi:anti-sigma regulatory factor (Ser/Thr protein kinase)